MNSPLPGYEEYVVAAAEGRNEEAKLFLLQALREAKKTGAKPLIAGLAQRLGTLLFRGGDPKASVALYEISEEIDKGSLLVKLEFAKFLWNELRNADDANAKCREIVEEALSNPRTETDDDFASTEYSAAASRLMDEISKA